MTLLLLRCSLWIDAALRDLTRCLFNESGKPDVLNSVFLILGLRSLGGLCHSTSLPERCCMFSHKSHDSSAFWYICAYPESAAPRFPTHYVIG